MSNGAPGQEPFRCVYHRVSATVEANIALVRRTYELWNLGGPEALVEQVWPADVVFHETPELPDGGIYRGVEAVAERMRDLVETGGHFQMSICSLEGCGDYVLATCTMRAQGTLSGLHLTQRICHVMRCRGGLVREFRAHFDARRARLEFERLCS